MIIKSLIYSPHPRRMYTAAHRQLPPIEPHTNQIALPTGGGIARENFPLTRKNRSGGMSGAQRADETLGESG
jgi:hypothetical protein